MSASVLPRWPAVLRAEPRWLSGMSWERIGWLFAVAGGLALFSAPADFIYRGVLLQTSLLDLGLNFAAWFVRYLVSLAPILLMLTIVDNLPLRGTTRIAALAAAIVVGAQFQWPIVCSVHAQPESACDDFLLQPMRSWREMLGSNTLWTMLWATPMALAYFFRRRDLRVARALHDAEVARADTQRRTLEAELQAMQARVEPGFLFDTLGEVGELFDSDAERGARMLDELIAYLRAALPDMRRGQSTLRQESDLVRAYLGILQIRAGPSLGCDVRIAASLEDELVPPMMLLPLIAAAYGATPDDPAAPRTSIAVDALVEGGSLRLVVTGRGPGLRAMGDAEVVRQVRERLRVLHGERAALVVDEEPGRRLTIVIALPHATA